MKITRFYWSLVSITTLLVASTHYSHAQNAADPLSAAIDIFLPSGSERKDLGKAHALITDGLSGRWLRNAELLARKGNILDSSIVGKACERLGVDITVSQFGFVTRMTYKSKTRGDGAVLDTYFMDRTGGTYTYHNDVEALFDRLGILDNTNDRFEGPRLNVLRESSGIAHVYRPSKDVLVVVPIAGIATFYVRCP